jgi:hypothetical protein
MRLATAVGLQKYKNCDILLKETSLCTSASPNVYLVRSDLTITRSKRLELIFPLN